MRRELSSVWVVCCTLLLLLLLVQLSLAGKLRERRMAPAGWLDAGVAPASSVVRLTIGLRSAGVEEMAETFWSISTPSSPQYLQLLTRDEAEQRFGASPQDRQRVQHWLISGGVREEELRHVSSAIELSTTAEVAARLFTTEMRQFKHAASGKTVVRAWGPASLPDELQPLIHMVTGLSSFPIPRQPSKRSAAVSGAVPAEPAVVPQTLRALYAMRGQLSGSSAGTQGVIEFEGECFNNSDTAAFAAAVGFTTANASIAPIPPEHIVGENFPQFPGIESTLDVQMIASTNTEAQTWFWIESGDGWLYEFALHVLNSTQLPQVVSISYGWWEAMQCWVDAPECELLDIDSNTYTAATNALFMKIAMQGSSILVSSGDSGANSRTDETCAATNLRPEFPASSPYVTTVGATTVVDASFGFTELPACEMFSCVSAGREVAVSRSLSGFTSGGGFSNITGAARPAYQDAAVRAYLSSGVALPPASFYNASGRAEPDVAALGSDGFIAFMGEFGTVGGTSMSAPIFAGVASLLNEVAVRKIGSPLGFLNPLLYQMAAEAPLTFHDITEGDNICTEEFCGPGCHGFKATKGWDPVTGLGTPNVTAMEAYVSRLMDDVLARRAKATATQAAAAAKVNLRQQLQPPSPRSSSLPSSLLSSQRPGPQRSHFRSSPFARRFNSSMERRATQLSVPAVQPDEVWQGVEPEMVSVVKDSLVVVVESGLLWVNASTHAVTGNYSVPSSLYFGGMATSSSAVYVLLLDELYGNVFLNAVDVQAGKTISSASLKYPTNLLAVDAAGKTALTSADNAFVVLLDTATGARRGIIANTSWEDVFTAAVNPANSDVWVLWGADTGPASFFVAIDVLSAGSNVTRFTIALPSTLIEIGSIAIGAQGKYGFVLYVAVVNNVVKFIIEQFRTDNGQSVRQTTLPSAPNRFISGGVEPGDVYYISEGQVVLLREDGTNSSFMLGSYPLLSLPSDVAVSPDGHVLVAVNEPFAIVELNRTGQLVASFPMVDEFAHCELVPFQNVAVDGEDDVYMPLCNSTVLIFDRRQREIASVYTGNGTTPRSVSPGPRGSLFFTDDEHRTVVTHISRDGQTIGSYHAPSSAAWLFTVHFDPMGDRLYVADILEGVIFCWAVNETGTPPRVINVTAAVGAPLRLYSLAVDHRHQQIIATAQQLGQILWLDMQGNLVQTFQYPYALATGVAVSPDGRRVYATDLVTSAIYVFHQQDSQRRPIDRVQTA